MSASSADQNDTPAAVAPWSTMPEQRRSRRRSRIAIASSARRRFGRESLRGELASDGRRPRPRPGWGSRSRAGRRSRRSPRRSRCTGGPRTTANANSVTLPTLPRSLSSSETVAPAALGLPDREHQAARDRVPVGRDHTVGRGVGALRKTGLEPCGEELTLAARVKGLAGLDACGRRGRRRGSRRSCPRRAR